MINPINYPKLKEVPVTVGWVDGANKVIKFQGFEDSFRHFHGGKIYFKYNNNLYSGIYQEEIRSFKIVEGFVTVDDATIFDTIQSNDTIYFYDTFKAEKTNELPTQQDIVEQFIANPAQYKVAEQVIVMQPILQNNAVYPHTKQSKPGLLNIFDKTKLNNQGILLQQENIIFAQDTYETIGNFKWFANIESGVKSYKIVLRGIANQSSGLTDTTIDLDLNLYSVVNQAAQAKAVVNINYCSFGSSANWQAKITKLNCITNETFCKLELKYIGTDTLLISEFESYITLFDDDSVCKDNDVRILPETNQVFQEFSFDNTYLQIIASEIDVSYIQLPTPDQIQIWNDEPSNRDAAIQALVNTKDQANGIAGLGTDGKLNIGVIPASLLGKLNYVSTWNASTNTPTLPAANTCKGDYYICNVKGIYQGVEYNVKDWIVSDGTNWDIVDNSEQLNGSNLTKEIWIDSVSGVDDDLPGRGQIGMPFKTIAYFLTKVDAGLITPYVLCKVSPLGGTNILTATGDLSMLHVGQYFNLDIGAGYLYPSNTKILDITGNTITLSGSSNTGLSPINLRFYDRLTVHCSGAFNVSAPINRIGITYETTTGATLIGNNGQHNVNYTDADFMMPAQTLKGNWKVFLTGSATHIYYGLTKNAGITQELYNFDDEWDYLYSTVVANLGGLSRATCYYTSNNNVKIHQKYNTSYVKNGEYLYVDIAGTGCTLKIEQKYTYGYYGCILAQSNAFDNLYIDGIFETPIGVSCIDIRCGAYNNGNHENHAIIKGDYIHQASNLKIYGNVFADTIHLQWYSVYSGIKENMIYGCLTATTNIVLTDAKVYGFISSPLTYLVGKTIIYGGHNTNFSDWNTDTNSKIIGNSLSTNVCIDVSNGGIITVEGLLTLGSTSKTVSNGKLVLNTNITINGTGFSISGGEIEFGTKCQTSGNSPIYNLSGGKVSFEGGKYNLTDGVPLVYAKSAGLLFIDGTTKIKYPSKTTNPIRITVNNDAAKALHLVEGRTNLDGINYSLLFAFDGSTYAPVPKIAGYRLLENNDF